MHILDIIILLLICITNIYYLYIFCSSFLDKRDWVKGSKIKEGIVFTGAVISVFLVNMIGNGDKKLCLIPIVYLAFCLVLYCSKIGNVLICVLIAYSILFGCDCLFAALMNFSNLQCKNMTGCAMQMLVGKLLEYIVFLLLLQMFGKKNRKMDKWLFARYLCIPLCSVGMMASVFYARPDGNTTRMQVLILVCFACLLLGNILVFSAFNQYAENVQTTMEQNIQLAKKENDIKHCKQMLQANEKHYEVIHDLKHYFNVIYKLSKEQQYDSIAEVLESLNMQMRESELVTYCEESHVLNLILSEYKERAEQADVKYDVYVEPGIVLNMVRDADIIAMVKNLLDNAMIASVHCKKEPFIQVRIFMQEIGGFCVIKVINRFSGELDKNGDSFVSTQTEPGLHGYGISSVNRIAEKYGGCLECSADEAENIFEAVLILSTVSTVAHPFSAKIDYKTDKN